MYSQDVNEQNKPRRSQQRGQPKRSVSSLSATQLERKRANDREAQRLIRQRTKDRIDGLEKQIADLKSENERLNKCLRQRSIREMEALQKRNHLEADGASWNGSKTTNPSRGRQVPSPVEPNSYFVLESSHGVTQEDYSPVPSDPLTTNAGVRLPQATAPVDISSSAYYWTPSTTCSSTDDSVDDGHAQYQRALPHPVYSLSSPYQPPPMSPATLHCMLPNGQLQLLPLGR